MTDFSKNSKSFRQYIVVLIIKELIIRINFWNREWNNHLFLISSVIKLELLVK